MIFIRNHGKLIRIQCHWDFYAFARHLDAHVVAIREQPVEERVAVELGLQRGLPQLALQPVAEQPDELDLGGASSRSASEAAQGIERCCRQACLRKSVVCTGVLCTGVLCKGALCKGVLCKGVLYKDVS